MFKLPENLSDVEDLAVLRDEALARQAELNKISDDDITDADIDELEAIPTALETLDAESKTREEAVTKRAERLAAARTKNQPAAKKAPEDEKKADPEPDEDKDPEGDEPGEPEPKIVVPNDASELIDIQEKEPVMASGDKQSAAERARGNAPEVEAPEAPKRPKNAITASANIGGEIQMGQELDGFKGLAKAFASQVGKLPQNSQGVGRLSTAQIQKPVDERFHLKRNDQERNTEKLFAAANEQAVKIDGKTNRASLEAKGALVAAGGFWAPSTIDYDIPVLEQEGQGTLVIPSVSIDHGGIMYTKGIDFSDIYDDSGFMQTEAQAEAGTPKNFIDVTAPEFVEARLDVIGYGVRAGFLTAAAWPELIARYLAGVKVAHSHKRNATVIKRIDDSLGTALVAGRYGSMTADSLLALDLEATRLRYKYRLATDATIEGMAPLWVMNLYKADLAYQEGVDQKAITDAQVNSWLAARHINIQWVYDWQDLSGTPAAAGTTDKYPTTVNVDLWVQGAYVEGTSDVVSLDTVYDTASLTTNTFTAAFFEEALMVFNPQGSGVKVTIPTQDYFGRYGAANITGTPITA